MLNYKAYELGSKTPYKVTQIRWQEDKKLIAFNGRWYKEDECVLCAGTGVFDSEKNEIYEGDILQLGIYDDSCYYKGEIGVVNFSDGRFCWSPAGGWVNYSLAGKSWRNLGNIAYINDITKYYTYEQIHKYNNNINKMFIKLFGNFTGILVEKYKKPILKNVKSPYQSVISYRDEKERKKLLHQYENYVKIKDKIERGEINPEILDLNLKEKK
jgi:hypothetical protein